MPHRYSIACLYAERLPHPFPQTRKTALGWMGSGQGKATPPLRMMEDRGHRALGRRRCYTAGRLPKRE